MGLLVGLLSMVGYGIVVLIFIRVAFSWIGTDSYRNPIFRFSYQVTEPLLRPVRNLMPGGGMGGLDFSPMIVSFAVLMVINLLSRLGG